MQTIKCNQAGAMPTSVAVVNPGQQESAPISNQRGEQAMLYLQLFHGRKEPKQILDGWGTEGPTFGPYKYVHTTYATDIKMGRTDRKMDREMDILTWIEDLIYYDGVYYGDMSVFTTREPADMVERWCSFDRSKAILDPVGSPKDNAPRLVMALEAVIDAHLGDYLPGSYDAIDEELRKAFIEDNGEHLPEALSVVMQRLIKFRVQLGRLSEAPMAIFLGLSKTMRALEAHTRLRGAVNHCKTTESHDDAREH